MPQHIGIVACSAEGAALCYRTICTEAPQRLGPHAHPEISLHSLPLSDYVSRIERDDWKGVGELMLRSAQILAGAGADFLICPDNTIHQAFPYVQARSPVPWLHIAEVVASSAAARGFRRVGISGTRSLTESDVYPQKLAAYGIEYDLPEAPEREEIDRMIMNELVYGIFEPQSIAYFQNVFQKMKDRGCDAVILGCTEIPLIMSDANSPLPTLDSTRLLARAAISNATKDASARS